MKVLSPPYNLILRKMVLESARLSSASDVTCAAHGVQTQSLCSPVKNTCILNNAVSGAVPASNTAMVKYPWQKMDA